MKLNVIKNRKEYLMASAILFIFSILSIFITPLNLGIDMTG